MCVYTLYLFRVCCRIFIVKRVSRNTHVFDLDLDLDLELDLDLDLELELDLELDLDFLTFRLLDF